MSEGMLDHCCSILADSVRMAFCAWLCPEHQAHTLRLSFITTQAQDAAWFFDKTRVSAQKLSALGHVLLLPVVNNATLCNSSFLMIPSTR